MGSKKFTKFTIDEIKHVKIIRNIFMCFSATASFTASGILAAVGLLSIAKARTLPMRIFASTPLLFAIQQASEGVLWTTNPTSIMHHAAL